MAEPVSGRRKLVRTAVIAAFVLGLGGCALKGGQNVSSIEGKTLFIKNCGSCHTLARANSKGSIGPNLDDAFAESLSQGFGRTVIGGIVEQQVEYPNSAGRMPKLPLTTRQAADIAAYVQYAAARSGRSASRRSERPRPRRTASWRFPPTPAVSCSTPSRRRPRPRVR
jgi:mono/diheme cytochrome c family protein